MAASLCFIIVHKLPRNIRFLLKINLNSKYQDVLYLNQGHIIQWAMYALKFALQIRKRRSDMERPFSLMSPLLISQQKTKNKSRTRGGHKHSVNFEKRHGLS